jgi:hypothetical protein
VTLPLAAERHIYVVRSEFADGQLEQDWNQWYDEVHVPELLTVPGFRSAARFQERGAAHRYLALYELDGPQVFNEARYEQITGWAHWQPHIVDWTRALYQRVPFPSRPS